MAQPAGVMGDRGDPRLHEAEHEKQDAFVGEDHRGIKPQHRKMHDPDVTFEEYAYYAKQTRAEEETHTPATKTGILSILIPSKSGPGAGHGADGKVKTDVHVTGNQTARAAISDEEWANASRALRTATRGAIFYLITTDILGPFGLPYAFATMGWG